MKMLSFKSLTATVGLSVLLLSGCATTGSPIGGGGETAKRNIANQLGISKHATNDASSKRCLYSVSSLRNQTSKPLTIIIGMSKSNFGVPSRDFEISLDPEQSWRRPNRGDGGKSDPDVRANPGRLVQIAALDTKGSFLVSRNLDYMPVDCFKHSDKNKRLFSIGINFVQKRNGIGIDQAIHRHY